jgi:hypothetical protein
MGFQSPQFESPVNMMGDMMKLKSMQQQNALAEQQMGDLATKRKRDADLDAAYRNAYDPKTGEINYNAIANTLAEKGQGSGIVNLFKARDEGEKARYERLGARGKAFTEESNVFQAQLNQVDPSDPQAPLLMEQFIRGHHAPGSVTAEILKNQGITVEQSLAALRNAVQTGTLPDFLKRSQLGAAAFIKANAPQFTQVNAGGYGYTQQIPGLGGPATEVKGSRFNVTRSPNTQTTNINLPALENAEQKGQGELNVRTYEGLQNKANLARKTAPAIDTALAVLDKGFGTGTGTATTAKIAGVLSALGVPEATAYASDAAVFQSTVQQTVLDRQFEQKGPQTEADAARITQTAANLGNPTDANRFLLNIAKAQAKRDIAHQRFFAKWFSTNNTYRGAEEAWLDGEGGKSLFADPALSKYAPKEEQGAAAPAATGSWGKSVVVKK